MSSSHLTRRKSLVTFAAFSLAPCAPVLAHPSIPSFTIDCGGQVSTGGTLRLTGSIGQPDAGAPIVAGSLQLRGGFLTSNNCTADINGSGNVSADDIFAFLDAWFDQNGQVGPALVADFNGSNAVTADDIFAFLDAWFDQNGVCGT